MAEAVSLAALLVTATASVAEADVATGGAVEAVEVTAAEAAVGAEVAAVAGSDGFGCKEAMGLT